MPTKKKRRVRVKARVVALSRRVGGLKRSVKALKKRVGKIKPAKRKIARKRVARKKTVKRRVVGARKVRASGAGRKFSSLENRFKLLEARFREHLDELRKLPSTMQEERFEEIHKRLDVHEKQRNALESRIAEIHSKIASAEESEHKIAHDIAELYFSEIARLSFKRSLNLEETLKAYEFIREKIREKKGIVPQEIFHSLTEQKKEEAVKAKTY